MAGFAPAFFSALTDRPAAEERSIPPGEFRQQSPVLMTVQIVRRNQSGISERSEIVDDEPLVPQHDKACSAQFLQGSVHVNCRKADGIGRIGLCERELA